MRKRKRKHPTMIKIWKELSLEQRQKLCDELDCTMGLLALMRLNQVWWAVSIEDMPGVSRIFYNAIRQKPRNKRI